MSMNENSKFKTKYLKDYKKPDYLIKSTNLTFEITPNLTKVTSILEIERADYADKNAPLVLNGELLTLISVKINDQAPNFSAQSTKGDIDFHEWCAGSWTLFFSHPKDFTPVCATEISALSASEDEFKKRNCKLIGLSVDSLESHFDWLSEMEETYGSSIEFPIIADERLYVSKLYSAFRAGSFFNLRYQNCIRRFARAVFSISKLKI